MICGVHPECYIHKPKFFHSSKQVCRYTFEIVNYMFKLLCLSKFQRKNCSIVLSSKDDMIIVIIIVCRVQIKHESWLPVYVILPVYTASSLNSTNDHDNDDEVAAATDTFYSS